MMLPAYYAAVGVFIIVCAAVAQVYWVIGIGVVITGAAVLVSIRSRRKMSRWRPRRPE